MNKELSALQKNILCGLLLGDASLQTQSNGKTWRLRVLRSEFHKEYFFIFTVFGKTFVVHHLKSK
jgi:LAGLIDADG DNA endonuclease family